VNNFAGSATKNKKQKTKNNYPADSRELIDLHPMLTYCAPSALKREQFCRFSNKEQKTKNKEQLTG
jgi:hypothetical protein